MPAPVRNADPSGMDLIYLLQSAGLDTLVDDNAYELLKAVCDSYMQSALDMFDKDVKWNPFRCGADTTRYYTPDRPLGTHRHGLYGYGTYYRRGGDNRLDLVGGLVDVPTTVMTGLTYDATTGQEIPGTVRVLNVDYLMRPDNAFAKRLPFRYIEFGCLLDAGWRSLKVTGPFGFTRILSEDVWRGLLAGGASLLQAEGGLLVTGANAAIDLGPLKIEFRKNGIMDQFTTWQTQFQATIKRYTRHDMGF